jgi:glycosyltransferase (activator-dependent family)
MRVLFCTLPQKTHFLTMAPLAWAMRTAGHEVRVASQPALTDLVTGAGLTAAPVGRNVDPGRLDTAADRAAIRRGLPVPYDLVERLPEEATWAEVKDAYNVMAPNMFKMDNFPMIADLVTFARRWKPDLVLWEPFTYAAPIAAKACGAVHGRLLFTMDVLGVTHEHVRRLNRLAPPADREDVFADWLGTYAAKYGFRFSADMISGQFTVDQTPPSLRIAADLDYLPMRYVPYGGAAVVPRWLWEPAARPRVALTLGLSATEHFDGYTFSVASILDALADLDIEVVATIAAGARESLGAVPGNARVETYVPLHALVPTCTAVVHHGGFGTLCTVALNGVPQLTLPYHFEGPLLCRRLAEQGAGINVHSDGVTGQVVRDNLVRLLAGPGFRENAAALRAEMLAMPSPNEVVRQIEELTAKYRAR